MRSARWTVALLLGCAGARDRPTPASPPRSPVTDRAARTGASWSRVAPRLRPSRIDNVAALADGSFVILAGSDVYRVNSAGSVTLACALDPNLAVTELHAAGNSWWVLAGEVSDPVVFRGEAGETGCLREALPSLVARDSPPGQLRSAQVGDVAVVWSSGGPMVRSRDRAHTWQRIPALPEVVAVTVQGMSLYAAALLGGSGSRTPFDRHGYDVFLLPDAHLRWELTSTPGDRAAPVALLPREAGGVVGLDVLGGYEITPQGRGRVGPSSGPHFARDRPRLLIPAPPSAAVGLTEGMLFEHRLTGSRPLPVLPGERLATAFDATPDGAFVVSDGHELWRVRIGGDPVVILRAPLEGGRPTRLVAAGALLAAVSGRDRLSVSRDGGETWATTVVPPEAGSARGLAVLPGGTIAVITAVPPDPATAGPPVGAIWIGDPSLHRVDLPAGTRVFENGASLHAIGDRWILAAGDVFVSDDQGGHWRRTLEPPPGHGEGWGVVALAAAAERTIYALDCYGALWRSDDAGDQFVALTPGRTVEGGASGRSPVASSDWLSWDGGDALLASIGRQLYRFDRDGHGGPVGSVRGVMFGAIVEDGAVIATSASPARAIECGRDGEPLFMAVSATGTLSPIPGVCAHRAVAFALDGDALYSADADGTIERASLRGLWREATESGTR